MFHDSTQRAEWIFEGTQEIEERMRTANEQYCAKVEKEERGPLLTWQEESLLCQHYQRKLVELCDLYRPPVPRAALGSAVMYLKRFYMMSSVMEFHPRDIFLCCLYIGFKVEEYNINVDQFVHVLASELREGVAEMILSWELMVMQRLRFHLTIHSPFRALEGFIIDMKTRCPHLANPELFRQASDTFLLNSFHSDVSLLFPPSQIALCSLRHAARLMKVKIDDYIFILLDSDRSAMSDVITALDKIEAFVVAVVTPSSSDVKAVEAKLQQSSNVMTTGTKRKQTAGEAPASKRRSLEDNKAPAGVKRL